MSIIYVLPCPCCGGEDFYIGPLMATKDGIECPCGLQLGVNWPEVWPKGVFVRGDSWEENARRMREHCIRLAIEAWNKRA
jgi:hypothetical protein